MLKLQSVCLCANLVGQAAIYAMVRPPKPGMPSYPLYMAEKKAVLDAMKERAILLAGNVGALRVWWRGDNLGYLGELGQRANGMVFERGKAPRQDKGMSLALPSGVPE
jgi:hypothetical protein